MSERGRETEEQIEKRLDAAKWEFEQSPRYNYIFVNDSLEECAAEIEKTIRETVKSRSLVDRLLNEKY